VVPVTAPGAPSTGRDETPDEALRDNVARVLYQGEGFSEDVTEWSDLADHHRRFYLDLADAVLAVVFSPCVMEGGACVSSGTRCDHVKDGVLK